MVEGGGGGGRINLLSWVGGRGDVSLFSEFCRGGRDCCVSFSDWRGVGGQKI